MINRRRFLKFIGVGAAASTVAPKLLTDAIYAVEAAVTQLTIISPGTGYGITDFPQWIYGFVYFNSITGQYSSPEIVAHRHA